MFANANFRNMPSSLSGVATYQAPQQSGFSYRGAGGNPEQTLQNVLESQDARINEYIIPLVDERLDTLGNNEIVDAAKDNAETAFVGAERQAKRQLSRYGVRMTPAQLRAFQRRQNIDNSLNKVNVVSRARTAQAERDTALSADLANKGSGLSNTAVAGLSNAIARDQQRDTAHEQNKAAWKNQMVGNALSLGAIAAFML